MKIKLLLLGLLFTTLVSAQNIINTPLITTGIIDLGEEFSLQFNIDQETICDSYIINVDVNHISKIINVNVDYTYVSTGFDSNFTATETIGEQLKLTGIYQVFITLSVPNKPEWNAMLFPGPVTVNDPINVSCSDGNIPFLDGLCPNLNIDVCACNGFTYGNECEAYLEMGNGAYQYSSCGQILELLSEPFDCDIFSSTDDNFFETYFTCTEDEFEGNELVFDFDHDQTYSEITFSSSSNDVSLLLTHMVNGVIGCLVISEGNTLSLEGIPDDIYYLIVDKNSPGDIDIEFCTSTTTEDKNNLQINIYPNPASDYLLLSNLNSAGGTVELYDLKGQLIDRQVIIQNEMRMETSEYNGLYILKISHPDGSYQSFQILMTNN